MARLWIHRATLCDILVDFDTEHEAKNWGLVFLAIAGEELTPPQTNRDIGSTSTLQLSVENTTWQPNGWNDRGTVLISSYEALQSDEPAWFIPYEREDVQMKEMRTIGELDDELDEYMFYRDMPSLIAF